LLDESCANFETIFSKVFHILLIGYVQTEAFLTS